MVFNKIMTLSPEVDEALRDNAPVVALESTIISHGMPYPRNRETAIMLEQTVREHGAVPATIALLNGKIHVGLSASELEALARGGAEKVSRRDIPVVLARKAMGATTVAATMICAKLAGIRLFATGGIGGVHRGAEKTMDISADLMELAQTDVAVVCAGAKAILDLGKTLEYLETQGVPVIGYQTDRFPAFYTRDSGYPAGACADNAGRVAEMLALKWSLGLKGGAIVANPVPIEAQLDPQIADQAIETALQEVQSQGVVGKDVTPFLLSRVEALTQGASLVTNIALVKNNAMVAAHIAKSLVRHDGF